MIEYSIIIPVYAHKIEHFFKIIKENPNIELIFVLLKNKIKYEEKSNIKFIISDNKGYAYAVNKGVNIARGEYLIIANDDIVFSNDFFKELSKIKKDIIVPTVYNYYTKNIESIGSKINIFLYNELNKKLKKIDKLHLTGSAFIIKKNIYNKIKMDNRYFMYYEDIDLSMRLKKQYKIFFSNNLKVFHKHSYSNFRLKRYFLHRNRILFLIKNYKSYLFFIIFYLLISENFIMYYQIIKEKSLSPLLSRIHALKLIRVFYKYENTD